MNDIMLCITIHSVTSSMLRYTQKSPHNFAPQIWDLSRSSSQNLIKHYLKNTIQKHPGKI